MGAMVQCVIMGKQVFPESELNGWDREGRLGRAAASGQTKSLALAHIITTQALMSLPEAVCFQGSSYYP